MRVDHRRCICAGNDYQKWAWTFSRLPAIHQYLPACKDLEMLANSVVERVILTYRLCEILLNGLPATGAAVGLACFSCSVIPLWLAVSSLLRSQPQLKQASRAWRIKPKCFYGYFESTNRSRKWLTQVALFVCTIRHPSAGKQLLEAVLRFDNVPSCRRNGYYLSHL